MGVLDSVSTGTGPTPQEHSGHRERWADVGRGFAIITIIFFHSALALQAHGEVDWKIWLCIALFSPVPIALFFFISGLFSQKIVAKPWSRKLTARIIGLAYVFLVWSVIDTVIALLLDQGVVIDRNAWSYLLDPKSALWFIWGLILFTVLANLVWRRWPTATFCIALFISLLSFAKLIPTTSFVYENLIRFFPFFLIGLSGAKFPGLVIRHQLKIFAVGSLIYGGLILAYIRLDQTSVIAGLIWVATAWVALPLSIAGSSLVTYLPVFGNLIGRLGRGSLAVYVAHESVKRLLVTAAIAVFGVVETPQMITVFVMAIAVAVVTSGLALLSIRCGLTALYTPPFLKGRMAS
jgi:uncharacterized membrane protein YcfT